MPPRNRISQYFPEPARGSEPASTPRLAPACNRTTRIDQEAADEPRMSLWDAVGWLAWWIVIVAGLVAGLWLAGVVVGCGFLWSMGL